MSSPGLAPGDELVEEPPSDRSSIRLWVLLLAGPVLWTLHFGVVYFFSEAACEARRHEEIPLAGSGSIVPVVVGVTLVLGAACATATVAISRIARGSDGDAAVLAWAGVVLGVISTIAILAAGVPALALEPC